MKKKPSPVGQITAGNLAARFRHMKDEEEYKKQLGLPVEDVPDARDAAQTPRTRKKITRK